MTLAVIALGDEHPPLDLEVLDRRRRETPAQLLEELADRSSRPTGMKLRHSPPHTPIDARAFEIAQRQMLDKMAEPGRCQGFIARADPEDDPGIEKVVVAVTR
jgi:hypothetical protein